MIRQLTGGLLVAMLVAGCQPVVEAGPPPLDDADACGASAVQHLVGTDWPQPLPESMTVVRVIPYGAAITMDYNPLRVNVELAQGSQRISTIRCG